MMSTTNHPKSAFPRAMSRGQSLRRGQQLTLGLQAGTANQETVNVLLLGKVLAVLAVDAATVEDPGLVGDRVAELGPEPLADGLVHLLGLLDGGDLAGADGPDGLVGDHDLLPVGGRELGGEGGQLALDDRDRVAGLALLERLAAAPDDADAALDGGLGLGRHQLVRLAQQRPPLRVAQDGPVDVAVLELGHADLARVGAVGLVVDVLRRHLDAGRLVDRVPRELEVQRWGGDHDLWRRKTSSVSAHVCSRTAAILPFPTREARTYRRWDPSWPCSSSQ
ncbi:8f06b728-0bcb-4c77-b950-6ad28b6375f7 [Thermothielavioides terrestris]|uniref:8f06b728-0bcb-4c77-b950-6ad28b6375f7 n=1 Tax=Thermothielavioides terrestris TaxID=2587410 RepID=A0A3S4BKV6_9PEZI|nr:8f06b728-0bcb-4c77-b950-6ad28b6375f7 [Thermothielavioides terrestris]